MERMNEDLTKKIQREDVDGFEVREHALAEVAERVKKLVECKSLRFRESERCERDKSK